MHSKKDAIGIYQAVGIQLMKVHEDELRAMAEKTGKIYLPSVDSSVPKRLHRSVRKSKSIEEAIEPPMVTIASEIRAMNEQPLRSVMLYRQALSTLMELATSKYGNADRVEAVARQLDERMSTLLRLPG